MQIGAQPLGGVRGRATPHRPLLAPGLVVVGRLLRELRSASLLPFALCFPEVTCGKDLQRTSTLGWNAQRAPVYVGSAIC